MTGGLGRTLAEIRADAEWATAATDGRNVFGRAAGDLLKILTGAATDEPPEFGTPTPAQWWARLLTLEPDVRLEAIDRLLRAADHAAECWSRDHAGRYEQLESRYRDLLQAVREGARVEILLADDAPVGWHLVLEPTCSTCGEPMSSPGCSKSPSDNRPRAEAGFHTVAGLGAAVVAVEGEA